MKFFKIYNFLFIRKTEAKTRISNAIIGFVGTILIGLIGLTKLFENVATLSYDIPFIFHSSGGTENVRIVYLDEVEKQSLDRRPQAKLLDRLAQEGAQIVVYDLIFDQPSNDPLIDQEFATAIRRFRGVDEAGNPIPGAQRRVVLLGCARDNSQKTGYAIEKLVVPNDVLLAASDDFGLVFVESDSFMVRKLTTGTRDELSLSWKAAVVAGANLREEQRLEERWINFAGPPPSSAGSNSTAPIQSVDAKTVLVGAPMSGFFKDKIVIVGGQPGVVGQKLGQDLFETPYNRFPVSGKAALMSGVEIQANSIANLINRNWIKRSSPKFDTLLIILFGLILGSFFSYLSPAKAITVAVFCFIAISFSGILFTHFQLIWCPWSIVVFLQIPCSLLWSIGANAYIEKYFRLKISEEQIAIRNAFSKYLSPEMLDQLTSSGYNIRLGGRKVDSAIMFTDLEAFTDLCNKIQDPQAIVSLLNDYFERTTSSIFEHKGIIIKYIGDAIFAAWGTLLPDRNSTTNAVRAAWKLFQNDKLIVEGSVHATRIGLHYGQVLAGNIGSAQRHDYTLIGDAVNIASRLESMNKLLDTKILLSGDMVLQLSDEFRTRFVGKFIVKGRLQSIDVYELIGPSVLNSEPAWIAFYHEAQTALQNNCFSRALILFNKVNHLRLPVGDGPSRFFVKQIEDNVAMPDGVVTLPGK